VVWVYRPRLSALRSAMLAVTRATTLCTAGIVNEASFWLTGCIGYLLRLYFNVGRMVAWPLLIMQPNADLRACSRPAQDIGHRIGEAGHGLGLLVDRVFFCAAANGDTDV